MIQHSKFTQKRVETQFQTKSRQRCLAWFRKLGPSPSRWWGRG